MRTKRDMTPRHFRERGKASELLAIHPEAMSVLYEPHEPEKVAEIDNGIAVLSIEGPLEHKGGWWFDTYESILCRYRSCIKSSEVRALLLKLDSPGGDAAGLNETVDAMRALKAKTGKPVYAYADESCYSAAYALACVADEIYLPPAGGVGSVGVVSCLVDWTKANAKDGIRYEVVTSGKRKADGNPNVPISSATLAHVQRRVDSLATLFFGLVSSARGMSVRAVAKLEADTFYGDDAVAKGLADGVMSLEDCLSAIKLSLDSGSPNKSTSKNKPTGRTVDGGDQAMKLLVLTKAVADAQAALESAPKDGKATARARLVQANAALAAKLAEADSEEEEEEEEEESTASSTGSSMSESAATGSATGTESTGSTGASDPGESARTGLYTKDRLVHMVKSLSGAKTIEAAMGWLDAKAIQLKTVEKATKRLDKLEAESKRDKIEKMIAEGKAQHRITPGNEKEVRKGVAEHGHRWLRSFLAATPPALTREHHADESALSVPAGVKATAEQVKVWRKMGFDEKKIAELSVAYEKERADMNARIGGDAKGSN